jgi:hypothetical protein
MATSGTAQLTDFTMDIPGRTCATASMRPCTVPTGTLGVRIAALKATRAPSTLSSSAAAALVGFWLNICCMQTKPTAIGYWCWRPVGIRCPSIFKTYRCSSNQWKCGVFPGALAHRASYSTAVHNPARVHCAFTRSSRIRSWSRATSMHWPMGTRRTRNLQCRPDYQPYRERATAVEGILPGDRSEHPRRRQWYRGYSIKRTRARRRRRPNRAVLRPLCRSKGSPRAYRCDRDSAL